MIFGGFQKLTLLDYPGKVACLLFTQGCNFRCPFCHNASLVRDGGEKIPDTEILEYLKKRRTILDGVCISGGEPLLHNGLKDFIKEVKALGYPVKLDTNGSFPEKLIELVGEGLIDYVAMDIKNSFDRYSETAGVDTDTEKIKRSINFLMNGNIEYEFRTTLVRELHALSDMESIGKSIQGAKRYYLQNFLDSGDILCPNMTAFDEETLNEMRKIALKYVPDVQIRGI